MIALVFGWSLIAFFLKLPHDPFFWVSILNDAKLSLRIQRFGALAPVAVFGKPKLVAYSAPYSEPDLSALLCEMSVVLHTLFIVFNTRKYDDCTKWKSEVAIAFA